MRVCFKIGVPHRSEVQQWGDYHLAKSFGEELKRRGHEYIIHILPEWYKKETRSYDVTIHLRGLSKYHVCPDTFNIMWLISHPEDVAVGEYIQYDLILVASHSYTKKLQAKVHIPVETLLQFVDTHVFYEQEGIAYQYPISFIGNTRNVFRSCIKDTLAVGYLPIVFGKGWEAYIDHELIKGQWIANSQVGAIYNASYIVLNDHWEDMKREGFVNNRVFDAAACGSIVINDDFPALEKLFPQSLRYSNKEELKHLIEEASEKPLEYRKKAKALQKDVLAHHTAEKRVDEYLEIMKAQPIDMHKTHSITQKIMYWMRERRHSK